LAIQPLPADPDALRGFAAELQAELARKDIEITARDAEIHAKTGLRGILCSLVR